MTAVRQLGSGVCSVAGDENGSRSWT